jgi:hypothetical protein
MIDQFLHRSITVSFELVNIEDNFSTLLAQKQRFILRPPLQGFSSKLDEYYIQQTLKTPWF